MLLSQGSPTNSSAEIATHTFEARSGTFEGVRRFAMKLQRKSVADSRWHVCTEAVALQRIAHPFIVRLEHAFQTPQFFVLLLELCSMDMNQRILSCAETPHSFCPGLPQQAAARYGGQVLLGLEYMHQTHRIVYRDMKPQNVLVSFADDAKLADFGTARYIEHGKRRAMSLAGTCGFLAPELVYGLDDTDDEDGVHDPFLPDAFAYGITLAIMLMGDRFAERSTEDEDDMPNTAPVLLPKCATETAQLVLLHNARDLGHLDPDACALLERLIQHRPKKRASLLDPEVKSHPFFLKTLNCADLEAHLLPHGPAAADGLSVRCLTTAPMSETATVHSL